MTIVVILGCYQSTDRFNEILLSDDFNLIRRGPYFVKVGTYTEYYYLHEAASRSQWAVYLK